MKNGGHFSFLPVPCPRVARRTLTRAIFFLAVACLSALRSSAQSTSENTDAVRGVVINSVTREPVARALVYSPDNRFATMTNSEGRFEFTLPKMDPATEEGGQDSNPPVSRMQSAAFNRPFMLMARKPGFMTDSENAGQNLQNDASKDLTLTLVPESLIVGTITLPSSEPPDSITLQIFRRQVQDGRARWLPVGGAQSRSDGEFRFADLSAGTYKLLTHEQLDRDPLTVDSLNIDPITHARRGPLVGYPPVYYQNASDFESAATIQLGAGQTQTVTLTLAKQPYYWVKVPVISPPENGVRVNVYSLGRKGPGFSLGYNNSDHAIEGLLPNGTYTLEASSFGSNGLSGVQSITIKGAPVEGPSMMLVPNASIPVSLKQEFTGTDHNLTSTWNINGRNVVMKGPRRYLANVTLEPADDMGMRGGASLRDPTRSDDDALFIDGVAPGSYWVRVHPALGYVASVRSGNLDLLHQPLFVAAGGAASPIEISIRDDVAEISGTVAGVPLFSLAQAQTSASTSGDARGWTSYTPYSGQAGAHLYCIPTSDSNGQFMQIWVGPDGSFRYSGLAPGTYHLLVFDREPPDFEYRNPDAMQAYDSKGTVIHLVGGQKERVQLQLISTSSSGTE
ncbi:MAG: hypothetical protein LAO30_10815 [Acidobacteriia bacterium]|nr:hypothetical protein [Terriglobia bacterium]